ncbi:hypothetical protein OCH239_14225 [Roseivivax halodurans JCM 10272]|uniref:histidine kinase n=1 Tax=Roseivivax halodurans JCM 10272 TaxID=1449350 RepID=X7EKK3_9RHOB|nr:PAS domain S-box protein [Roseivivax halodurans]ETX15693.1 hypothetical protein OCH239_14225 [Roseivivax halodurans JCM 10272]
MAYAALGEVFDAVIAFIGILAPDGTLIDVNQPGLDVSGLVNADIAGTKLWDGPWFRHDPVLRERVRAATGGAASGETQRFEADIRVAGGDPMTIDLQISPQRGAHGRIVALVASATDVTDRRRAELELAQAHETFITVVRSCPFGIVVLDADLTLRFMSDGAKLAFDDPLEKMIGTDYAAIMREAWPAEMAEEIIGRFRHTLETGESFRSDDTTGLRRDRGAVESYDWRLERIFLPDRRFGVVCHFYDLSERTEYESVVRESEALFRSTFENAAVGMAHVAPDGTWLRVNQCLCDLLGYSKAELLGLRFQDVTHPEDLEADVGMLQEVIEGKRDAYEMDKRYIARNGDLVWVTLTVSCIRRDDGSVEYFISAVRDITRQKAAEEQRDLLVHELNHRVKNILASIQSVASHTRRNSGGLEDFFKRFDGRLRAISRAHDSIFDDTAGSASLREILEGQFAIYYAEGSRAYTLDGPNLGLDAALASKLGVVFHEMITNAMKYGALSHEGGHIAIEWSVRRREGGREIALAWTETGGPAAAQPTTFGFGSTLIDMMVVQSLGGTLERTFSETGLVVAMTVRL